MHAVDVTALNTRLSFVSSMPSVRVRVRVKVRVRVRVRVSLLG